MRTHLLVIDPQNDFCVADDGHGNKGALVVPSAHEDMKRVADLLHRCNAISEVSVTLDSHHAVGIERPAGWVDALKGKQPAPFTTLRLDETGEQIVDPDGTRYIRRRSYRSVSARSPSVMAYMRALKEKGEVLTIWPKHCVIGTWGACVVSELAEQLGAWEERTGTPVDYVFKGMNDSTEHFSAIQAEVPDMSDPSTVTNWGFLARLAEADRILVCGEALSHCVARTVWDIVRCASGVGVQLAKKIVLLTDAMSSVPGFEPEGQRFLDAMDVLGVRTSTTVMVKEG